MKQAASPSWLLHWTGTRKADELIGDVKLKVPLTVRALGPHLKVEVLSRHVSSVARLHTSTMRRRRSRILRRLKSHMDLGPWHFALGGGGAW